MPSRRPGPFRAVPRVEALDDRITPAAVTVTNLTDVVNGNTSGIAALKATPGPDGISLREAVLAAEADAAADVIDFAPNLARGTIGLLQFPAGPVGDTAFEITTPITIRGSGQVLTPGTSSGPSSFRFFHIDAAADGSAPSLTLENLVLRGGRANGGSGTNGGGGAAGLGGAIFNQGELTVRNTVFDGNAARGGAGSPIGAGVYGGGGGLGGSAGGPDGGGPNGGTRASEATGGLGGFGGGGGASTIVGDGGRGGFGGGGGAASNGDGGAGGFGGGGGGTDEGTAGAGGFGGGNGLGSGALSVGGGGAGMGGAIFNLGGTVNVVNSTFIGNTASGGLDGAGQASGGGYGGAIANVIGTVRVVNATFKGNTAAVAPLQVGRGGGDAVYNLDVIPTSAGMPDEQDAVVTVANSIFVGLQGAAASDSAQVVNEKGPGTDFAASVTATGPNLSGSAVLNVNGATFAGPAFTLASGPVVAEALADNGGFTPTLAPLAQGSGAVDTGSTAAAADPVTGAPLTTDQRGPGFARVSGGVVDLGAFEVQQAVIEPPPPENPPPPPPPPPPPAPPIVFTNNGKVLVYDASTGQQTNPPDPFPGWQGEVRTASADLTGDGVPDVVFVPGNGGGSNVYVRDGKTGATLFSFLAYEPEFRGGMTVALADITGDRVADIVVGAAFGGSPLVRVFDGATGAPVAAFWVADPALRTGTSVAAGDVTGDGVADVAAALKAPGEDALIKLIDGARLDRLDARGVVTDGALVLPPFTPFPGTGVGVFLAIGDVNGDRTGDLIVGAGDGGGPLFRVYLGRDLTAGSAAPFLSQFAYDPAITTGARVAAYDLDGDGRDEVVTVPGPGGGPHAHAVDVLTGNATLNIFTFLDSLRDPTNVGTVD